MTENHTAASHHGRAALQHSQAAGFHSSAARHFETGKDYAHAAHQSLLARGHSLRAMKEANAARLAYAPHHLSEQTKPSEPAAQNGAGALEKGGSAMGGMSAAEHHAAAASHHDKAAHHHQEAARFCAEQKFAAAGHEAQMAHRHAHYSVFHEDEAAMHYSEHYGRSGQSAEIA